MIVKCVRNDSRSFHPCALKALDKTGELLPSRLEVGQEYVCYGVGLVKGILGFFLITHESIRQPMFFQASFFEIIEATLPRDSVHSTEPSRDPNLLYDHFFLPEIFEQNEWLMSELADHEPEAVETWRRYREKADREATQCE